jgi:ABC-type multidrug transport system ATPase subunit
MPNAFELLFSLFFAQTIVGGALIKGISGGERKRTSVGVELVVKPALVFLDEPVSFLASLNQWLLSLWLIAFL